MIITKEHRQLLEGLGLDIEKAAEQINETPQAVAEFFENVVQNKLTPVQNALIDTESDRQHLLRYLYLFQELQGKKTKELDDSLLPPFSENTEEVFLATDHRGGWRVFNRWPTSEEQKSLGLKEWSMIAFACTIEYLPDDKGVVSIHDKMAEVLKDGEVEEEGRAAHVKKVLGELDDADAALLSMGVTVEVEAEVGEVDLEDGRVPITVTDDVVFKKDSLCAEYRNEIARLKKERSKAKDVLDSKQAAVDQALAAWQGIQERIYKLECQLERSTKREAVADSINLLTVARCTKCQRETLVCSEKMDANYTLLLCDECECVRSHAVGFDSGYLYSYRCSHEDCDQMYTSFSLGAVPHSFCKRCGKVRKFVCVDKKKYE